MSDTNTNYLNRKQVRKLIEDLKLKAEQAISENINIEKSTLRDKIKIKHGEKKYFFQDKKSNGVSTFLKEYYSNKIEQQKDKTYFNFTNDFSCNDIMKDSKGNIIENQPFLKSNKKQYAGRQIAELITSYNDDRNGNMQQEFKIKKQIYLIIVALYEINILEYKKHKKSSSIKFKKFIYNKFSKVADLDEEINYNYIGLSISTLEDEEILPIKLKINFDNSKDGIRGIDYMGNKFWGNLKIEEVYYKFDFLNSKKTHVYNVILRKSKLPFFGTFQGCVGTKNTIRAGRFIVNKIDKYDIDISPIKLYNNDNLESDISKYIEPHIL